MERHRTTTQRKARLIAAAVMMMLGAWLLIRTHEGNAEPAAQRAQRLKQQHGIALDFGDPKAFYASPYDAGDAKLLGVDVEQTDAESAAIALEGIELALKPYPAG